MSMISMVYDVPELLCERLLSDPDFFDEFTRYDNPESVYISLEKSWHGLHHLLTGEAWEPNGPKAFLLGGGTDVPNSPCEYGARVLSPSETTAVHTAISSISDDELWGRYSAAEMTAEDIYPMIWDEPEEELREEYVTYFHELQKLVANAASNGHGLLVYIS